MKKYFSFLMIFGLLLTACGGRSGGSASNGLVGSWQDKTLGYSMKLSSDGKFTVTDGKTVAGGTYRVEGDKVFTKAEGDTTEVSATFDLSGDTLKLKDSEGKVITTLNRISDESFSALLPK